MRISCNKSILNIIILVIIIFLTSENVFSQLDEIENLVPKNVPLKIEFKNYDTEDWEHDLEITVTNTGKKPIYYLYFNLFMDGEYKNGGPVGTPLLFGSNHLFSTGQSVATTEDISIKSGETYSFKINKNTADARLRLKASGKLSNPRKVVLELSLINFGDGTGAVIGEGKVYPFKKKI